jgi:hypothetical protein
MTDGISHCVGMRLLQASQKSEKPKTHDVSMGFIDTGADGSLSGYPPGSNKCRLGNYWKPQPRNVLDFVQASVAMLLLK